MWSNQKPQKKKSKTLRNVVISVFVLLVLFLGAGTAYTLFVGSSTPPKAVKEPKAESYSTKPLKPTTPSPNAPVGVSVSYVTSPVAIGSNASLTAKTTAGANCTITVIYAGKPAVDSGLAVKKADDYGMVTWAWTVNSAVPLGTWPIKITCATPAKSGVVETNLQVIKQ